MSPPLATHGPPPHDAQRYRAAGRRVGWRAAVSSGERALLAQACGGRTLLGLGLAPLAVSAELGHEPAAAPLATLGVL